MSIYVEVESVRNVKPLISAVKEMGIIVTDAHLDKSTLSIEGGAAVSMLIKLPRKFQVHDAIEKITDLPYVVIVEEN
jgi:hypothetical protein